MASLRIPLAKNPPHTAAAEKVWLHVALSVLAMNVGALARIREGNLDQIRACTLKVA